MESAACIVLILKMGFASCLGVMFGWQPMPDGSHKVEYIVQIEPELAATLQEGQSIPITSDIPDDIGPIGRIRIVVGRDELPRQKLETRFKPWPGKQSRNGQSRDGQSRDVIETQHRVSPVEASGAGRYGNLAAAAKNAILPPGGAAGNTGAAAGNPFGRALQQGVQQAKNLAADLKREILPPSGNEPTSSQLFGQGGASRSVQNAINNTANNLRRGMQQNVDQVAGRTGQQIRQAADNLGQNAREAAGEFGRSLLPEQSILNNAQNNNSQNNAQNHAGHDHSGHDHSGHDHAGHNHGAQAAPRSSATILPPQSSPAARANNGSLTTKGRRIDTPITPRQPVRQTPRQQPQRTLPPRNIADQPPARTGIDSQFGRSGSSRQETNNQRRSRYDDQANQAPDSKANWPTGQNDRDPFDVDNRRPILPGNNPNNRPRLPEYDTASFGQDGPALQPPAQQNADSGWPSRETYPSSAPSISAPSIHAGMIDPPGGGAFNSNRNANSNPAPAINEPYEDPSRDYRWNDYGTNLSDGGTDGGPDSDNKTLFPLLLSWVLLSGSGAGNAYLWWSYLDVRHKYRGVVHGSPRRRDRYDD